MVAGIIAALTTAEQNGTNRDDRVGMAAGVMAGRRGVQHGQRVVVIDVVAGVAAGGRWVNKAVAAAAYYPSLNHAAVVVVIQLLVGEVAAARNDSILVADPQIPLTAQPAVVAVVGVVECRVSDSVCRRADRAGVVVDAEAPVVVEDHEGGGAAHRLVRGHGVVLFVLVMVTAFAHLNKY